MDAVSELSLSWDLPAVTKINKKWLHNKLLVHAVSSCYLQVDEEAYVFVEISKWTVSCALVEWMRMSHPHFYSIPP